MRTESKREEGLSRRRQVREAIKCGKKKDTKDTRSLTTQPSIFQKQHFFVLSLSLDFHFFLLVLPPRAPFFSRARPSQKHKILYQSSSSAAQSLPRLPSASSSAASAAALPLALLLAAL